MMRPEQNDRHFAHDIFKSIFFNEKIPTTIQGSMKSVSKDPIDKNISKENFKYVTEDTS